MEQVLDSDIEKKRKELQEILIKGVISQEHQAQIEEFLDLRFKTYTTSCNKRMIEKVESNYPYQIMKEAMRKRYDLDQLLCFYINKNFKIKGKITNLVEDGIVEIPLIIKATKIESNRYKEDVVVTKLFFFGEKIRSEWNQEEILTHKFYLHRMIVKAGLDQETYMLLSENKLNLEEYNIEGMLLDLEDFSDISKYARLMKKNHVVFVNSYKPSRKIFKNHKEMFSLLDDYKISKDNFFKYLFSLKIGAKRLYFPHPNNFEQLISSFVLSAKYDSSPYPLHLLVIGKQGGGKSKAQEAVFEKLDEIVPIVEGAGSTMKSLIPSFNSQQTKAGALIESNRICFVDEFFRILMRVEKDDRENQLTHLNPLLEHKLRRFGSGNNYLDGNMSSKLFAVTNPIFGTSSMQTLCNKLDNSFVSRILVWFQSEEHYKEVTSKDENQLETFEDSFPEDLFLSIYDHCNAFKTVFDKEKVLKIYNEGKEKLDVQSIHENVKGVYASRYKHHLACLIDGIIKTRCLLERDESFTAKDEDYLLTSQIWNEMLANWVKGIINERYDFGYNKEERYYN